MSAIQLAIDFAAPTCEERGPEYAEFDRWLSTGDLDDGPFEQWEIDALRAVYARACGDYDNAVIVSREYQRLGPDYRQRYVRDEEEDARRSKAAYALWIAMPDRCDRARREAKLKLDYAKAHRNSREDRS